MIGSTMRRLVISEPLAKFFIWVAISIFLIGLDSVGWLGAVRGLVEGVLVPVEQTGFRASQSLLTPIETLRFWRSGAARIADLERQVAELSVDATKLLALEEENEAMRRLLGAQLPAKWRFIPAPLLGRGDEVTIGVGKRDGVSKGDAVVREEVLIATVKKASERQSSLMLLTDANSKISVYVPRTGTDGILVGRFGSQMVMTQILQSEKTEEGDTVVSDGKFGAPRGLVVGKVGAILSDETDVYKEVLVEPILNFALLYTVFVVKE